MGALRRSVYGSLNEFSSMKEVAANTLGGAEIAFQMKPGNGAHEA
jgi:hypothetical protein